MAHTKKLLAKRNQVKSVNFGESLENAVLDATGLHVTVYAGEHRIRVRTRDFAEFYMAKSVIKQRTGLEIIRA